MTDKKLFGFSVVVIPEGKSYSSWCPEVDVASQGQMVEKAIASLKEALELHLECMSASEMMEVRRRPSGAPADATDPGAFRSPRPLKRSVDLNDN